MKCDPKFSALHIEVLEYLLNYSHSYSSFVPNSHRHWGFVPIVHHSRWPVYSTGPLDCAHYWIRGFRSNRLLFLVVIVRTTARIIVPSSRESTHGVLKITLFIWTFIVSIGICPIRRSTQSFKNTWVENGWDESFQGVDFPAGGYGWHQGPKIWDNLCIDLNV